MPFGFGVLVKDRRSEDFPDFRERFFFGNFLFVIKVRNIKNDIANNAKVKKSASIGSLEIFVVLALRVEGSVAADATPNVESFRVIGEDR